MNVCPCCKRPLPDDQEVRVSEHTHTVMRGDQSVRLSPTQFKLFKLLFDVMPKRLSNDRVIRELWSERMEPGNAMTALGVHVFGLRRTIALLDIEVLRPTGRYGDWENSGMGMVVRPRV